MEFFGYFPDTRTIIKIYQLYETALADTHVVCGEKCADCCTCNVIVTSLEAAFVAVAGWTVATLIFHLLRFIWIFVVQSRERIREEGAGF